MVKELSGKGLVDANRVGLIGFSRSGFPGLLRRHESGRHAVGAAIATDNALYDFVRIQRMRPPAACDCRRPWIASTADRVSGGTLPDGWNTRRFSMWTAENARDVLHNGREGALESLNLVGAFRLNDRPIEFVLFPDGAHQLLRPRERVVSMQNTVDWMSFWLQATRPNPEKASRYAR